MTAISVPVPAADRRAAEYPSVQSQLDLLRAAIVELQTATTTTLTTPVQTVLTDMAAIDAAYPL